MKRVFFLPALLLSGCISSQSDTVPEVLADCSLGPCDMGKVRAVLHTAKQSDVKFLLGTASEQKVFLSDYLLDSGDHVSLLVHRHPDLSGEHVIASNGVVDVPLVGAIDARGLTTTELASQVRTELVDRGVLVAPDVSVRLLIGRPAFISGEVNDPGAYPVPNGRASIRSMIAIAGGETYRANLNEVEVRRAGALITAKLDDWVLPGDHVTLDERWF